MARIGFQYNFFLSSNEPLNIAYTMDGSNPPPAVPGTFNLELVTNPPFGASFTLPAGYRGLATFPGGTGQQLSLVAGDFGVVDTGSNDIITLGAGNATVGGAQHDTITGGIGNQFIDGSAGNQSITGGAAGNETVYGGAGDTINSGGANVVIGGVAGDTITGGTGNQFIDGTSGHQNITAGTGNTTIYGGAGDLITGGANTTIGGGQGNTISGGAFIDGSAGNLFITGNLSGRATIW
ncbi:MAG TPA: hypothetical protein VM782_11850, partial [Stellaceae bacterium]|nr:hypothetical protein [Stellaceae bacterium]